jgi:hypothetical protein
MRIGPRFMRRKHARQGNPQNNRTNIEKDRERRFASLGEGGGKGLASQNHGAINSFATYLSMKPKCTRCVLVNETLRQQFPVVRMRRLDVAILLAFFACAAASAPRVGAQSVPKGSAPAASSTIVVPAWTTVPIALTRPVLAKTAHVGDSVYGETVFPVAVHDRMAIPAGSYVEGQIDDLTPPS